MSSQTPLPCLFADCQATFPTGENPDTCDVTQPLEKHLIETHRLVIDSIVDIADLHGYLSHWRQIITRETVKVHCFVFQPGPGASANESDNSSTEYLFLSYDNPDDAQLREQLHLKRLAEVTAVYQRERSSLENFPCIFCNDVSLNRQMIFEHLSTEHSFQLGDPDSMVFVPELLHSLADMINSLRCLYCEKQFRDRFVLKEHMRKRNHRRLKPANSVKYAKYYLSNYLEQGGLRAAAPVDAVAAESDDEADGENGTDARWLDLEDADKELLPATADSPAELQVPVCQLCLQEDRHLDPLRHLAERHSVDLRELSLRHGLDFYQRLRLLARISDQSSCATAESVDSLAAEVKLRQVSEGMRPATQWEVTLADLCDDI